MWNVKKAYLDSNVIIDLIDNRRDRHTDTVELIQKLSDKRYSIFISEDMLTTIYFINKDHQKTLKFFKLIQKSWNIVVFGKNVIKKAINLSLKTQQDFEDILQCLCAVENHCDVLITNDKDFYDCGVVVQNCQDFLKTYG
ncbi:MAG: PIN domain-containing protein [Gammaproteobacteria bacterium]|nr:MAG: PIN domain-containing protein [Gammaproteobacteria bacterium]